MAKIEAVIIRRSDEENTIAIVTAECDLEMVANHVALIGAVANAVTRWAKHGRGKELLARKGTINVGDLRLRNSPTTCFWVSWRSRASPP